MAPGNSRPQRELVRITNADADCADPGESLVDTDCNDADAAVHPGAADGAGDGLDSDCDGNDAPGSTDLVGGCGCAAGDANGLGWLVGLALFARRRRR